MSEIYYDQYGQPITRERLKRMKEIDIVTIIDLNLSDEDAADQGLLPTAAAEALLAEWLEQWANHIRVNDETLNDDVWLLDITCPGHIALKLNNNLWTVEPYAIEADFIEA
tara:strand:- start:909 stop:1241 length:333 start_codon:yes stop_codon:yes gene_type:complete